MTLHWRLKRSARKQSALALFGVLCMIAGAWLIVLYLNYVDPAALKAHENLESGLFYALILVNVLHSFVDPVKHTADHSEPAPALTGSFVVIATGLAIVIALVWYQYLALAGAAFLLTTFVTARVYAFANEHKDEIGEARFKVS